MSINDTPGGSSFEPNGGWPPGGKRPPFDANKARDLGQLFKKIGKGLKILIPLVIVALFVFSGIYQLDAKDEAVITRFGRYVRTETEAGLKFKIPLVEQAHVVDVEGIRRMEFGFRSSDPDSAYVSNANDPYLEEAKMLTSDENLVIADWAILYNVSNSYDYLFNVNDPEGTLRVIAESSYRRVVASHPLDDILTNQKDIIQNEVLIDLQDICNKYNLGVTIKNVQLQDAMPPDEVKAAFLDVTNALEEKNAKINDAMKYENEKLPMARGESVRILNEAEAYKQQRINEASGAVARFKAIQTEYAAMPTVMRTRMYLEMVSEVFPKVSKIYFVDDAGNTVQFLPLDNLTAEKEG